MVGILHLQDLFKYAQQSPPTQDLRSLVWAALFIPEVMSLDELIRTFQQHHTQMALVVDEHGFHHAPGLGNAAPGNVKGRTMIH